MVSGDHHRGPVQEMRLLSENRFDLWPRKKAGTTARTRAVIVIRPFLPFPFCRMRTFHDPPPTIGKSSRAFPSVDGANIGEASPLQYHGSPGRNHPMRERGA